MTRTTRALPLVVSALFVWGCSGSESPRPNDLAPGVVTGVVRDTNGDPIGNARVMIDPALTVGDPVIVHTNSEGIYRVEGLPVVPYDIYAWATVTFGVDSFCLRMGMPDPTHYDTFTPTHGAVRDFQWQLTGPIPEFTDPPVFFGGSLHLDLASGDFTESEVEITLTPVGARIDGSAATTLTWTFSPDSEESIYDDIPVADYTVSGVIRKNGETRPLHIGVEYLTSYDEQTENADLIFEPGGNQCISLASGVGPAYLFASSPFEVPY